MKRTLLALAAANLATVLASDIDLSYDKQMFDYTNSIRAHHQRKVAEKREKYYTELPEKEEMQNLVNDAAMIQDDQFLANVLQHVKTTELEEMSKADSWQEGSKKNVLDTEIRRRYMDMTIKELVEITLPLMTTAQLAETTLQDNRKRSEGIYNFEKSKKLLPVGRKIFPRVLEAKLNDPKTDIKYIPYAILEKIWTMSKNEKDESLKQTVENKMSMKFMSLTLQTLLESVLPEQKDFLQIGKNLLAVAIERKLKDPENANKIIPYAYLEMIANLVEQKDLPPSVQQASDRFIPRALKNLSDEELDRLENSGNSEDDDDWDTPDYDDEDFEDNYTKKSEKWFDEDLAKHIENEKTRRNRDTRMN